MLYFLAVLFIQGSASIFGTSEHLLLLTIGSCTSRVYIVIAAIDIAVNEFEVGLGPEGRAAEVGVVQELSSALRPSDRLGLRVPVDDCRVE